MKGIAGIVYPDVFQMNNLIQPMLDTVTHRCYEGGRDLYTYKNIQIGVCGGKLAFNEKKTIAAEIDGTILNQSEIRRELIQKGFPLRNQGLAELVLYAYECWDTGLFDRLNGEFSIIVLDQRKKRLILCRDRIGKKPLYWFHNQHHFIFASELKSLLATGAVPQTPALDALSSYLYFGYIPQDMSPIAGVNKLLPAHYLQYNFDGSKAIGSYWSYSSYFEKQYRAPLPKAITELKELVIGSVKASLSQEDQEVGCFLSGGLGSASIAYYASQLMPPNRITAYTAGFSGQNDADVDAAGAVANQLGIGHQGYSITQEHFLDDLVKILWHLDEPIADPQITSSWKLVAVASEKSKKVISGMGSDELFAGHSRYSIAEMKSSPFVNFYRRCASLAQMALIPVCNLLYQPLAFKLIKQSRINAGQYEYVRQSALMDEKEIYDASPRLGGIFDPEVFLSKFHHLHRVKSTVASYLYFDVKTRLPDQYLLQYERITAAHSISWSAPFLAREVIEFLAKLPEPEYLEEKETASYLKAMVKGSLPEVVLDRPKRTRKEFLKPWLTSNEMVRIFKLLQGGTLVDTGLISELWLTQKISKIQTSPVAFKHLWSVLVLEIWFRIFINKGMQPSPPEITVKQLLNENA